MSLRQQSLAGRRVIVTGGRGFIGAPLCRRLAAAGAEVWATSRADAPVGRDTVIWRQADLADRDSAAALFAESRPDAVFHLAGAVGASPDLALVPPTFASLLVSTVNILLAAAERGCGRVILVGSFTEPPPGAESWPVPGSPYAAAKWAASGYGRMFHALYGTPVTVLRPFMAYGPGQAPGKLIPSVVRSLLRGESPALSSGAARADWIYVDDVIEAFVGAIDAPDAPGRTIDLGTGELVSVRSVVQELAAIIGGPGVPRFGALPDRPHELEVAANTAVAGRVLGWRATTSLGEGLRRTVAMARA